MRLVNIEYIQEGAILARPVIDSTGRILLQAGMKMTSPYVQRLHHLGCEKLYIEDERLDDVQVNMAIEGRTRESAYQAVKSIRHSIESNQILKMDQLRGTVQRMIADVLSCEDVIGYLCDVRGYDEYTFHHSINSTILALVIGMSCGYHESKLVELGLGVMMHDVGKIKIPTEILNKKEPLTKEEYAEIQKHTIYGYEILRRNDELGLLAAHVAFQHQERWDGSGYPRGLKNYQIHEYGRIAAVADVFEALTSNRPYRPALEPYQAYEYILAYSGTYFEPRLLDIFAKKVSIYPNGSGVLLSNGQRGNVIKQNPGYPSRPCVRMLYQEDEPLNPPLDYDLRVHNSLLITGTEHR